MNTKFFKYIIPALSLVFSVNFTSCLGDLDVTPIDPNLNVEFDQNANFAKIYAGLAITGNKGPDGQGDIADTDEGASGLMRMLFNLNELPTDEAICAWSGDVDVYPLNFAKFTASNGVVLNMFNRLYIQIAQCNNFLIQTEGKDDEESLTQRAEVRFIRALDYYYLIDLYGNVPFVDENTGIGTYVPERITRANLYTYIEKELKEIEPQMKAPRANVYGRADQAAVWMLLSRLYLNAEVYTGTPQWSAAAEYSKKVMDAGFSLAPNYGDNFLAITGCGPTALSMVYVGLTGDTSMNPYTVAQMAQEDGFYVNGSGSSWSMMTELATKLGLSAQELSLSEDSIRQELSQGHPIICIMGPGDFTTSGHFVVLTGVDSDGKITVNDSNSKKNSNKAWKIDDLMSQIRDLWVYQ